MTLGAFILNGLRLDVRKTVDGLCYCYPMIASHLRPRNRAPAEGECIECGPSICHLIK